MAAVEFKVDGNIAVVTLNRPEARNAVSPEVAVRLAKAWEEIKSNDQIPANWNYRSLFRL